MKSALFAVATIPSRHHVGQLLMGGPADGRAGVRAESDPHADGLQRHQVAGLEIEELACPRGGVRTPIRYRVSLNQGQTKPIGVGLTCEVSSRHGHRLGTQVRRRPDCRRRALMIA